MGTSGGPVQWGSVGPLWSNALSPSSVASDCCPNDTQPKMFRLWVIALLLLPSLASARVLPSSHLNRLRGERVKDSTFIPESIDSNELQEFNGFMESNDSFESDESPEYSSSESGESESTTMLPISPPEEDQEVRFRYALSQVLLPPPKPKEQPGSSKLNLPPAVQQERASMLLHGETSFQPYANLDEEDQLEDLDEVDEVEDLEGSVDELPELAAWERYRGPNKLELEGEKNLEDYEDYQYKEDEDDLENGREIVKDKWFSEEDGNEEVDGGEWQEEEEVNEVEEEDEEEEDEEEDEEDDLEQNDEEEWLPELSAGVKYRGPSIMVDLVEGQVPK